MIWKLGKQHEVHEFYQDCLIYDPVFYAKIKVGQLSFSMEKRNFWKLHVIQLEVVWTIQLNK